MYNKKNISWYKCKMPNCRHYFQALDEGNNYELIMCVICGNTDIKKVNNPFIESQSKLRPINGELTGINFNR